MTVGRAQQRRRAIDSDRLASTRRVRNPIDKKDDIWAAFDSITYQKGGAVLEMFEASMTPQRFREGVRMYMKKHANSNASTEDFVAHYPLHRAKKIWSQPSPVSLSNPAFR